MNRQKALSLFIKQNLGLFITIILSYWAVKPLFERFMFPIHDDTQVARVYEMAKALKDGQFPVRWVADLGYGFGYPIFNFYSPLPYYFGAILNVSGFDILKSTQIMFIIGILLSGIFMYLLTREFWGKTGGIISAIFYIYAPYHAVDIYVRGAAAELWAIAFLPFIFWTIIKFVEKKTWLWVVIGSLAYGGLILSHNITAMLATPVILIYMFFLILMRKLNKKEILLLVSIIIFGLSLSAFFWLPAILEKDFTNVASLITGGSDYKIHFVCLQQLWDSPWGFGGSILGCNDGFSLKIGKLHILAVIVALLSTFIFSKKDNKRTWIYFFVSLFLISVFMTLEISKPVWQVFSFLSYVQFPWRFLTFAIFSASFLAGVIPLLTKKFNWLIKTIGILIILCFLAFNLTLNPFGLEIKYFVPQFYLTKTADDYASPENLKWQVSKISDEYLPKNFPIPKNPIDVVDNKLIPSNEIHIKNVTLLSSSYKFTTNAFSKGNILIKTAYFSGWKVFIDRKESDYKIYQGQILVSVPKGEHQFQIIFTNTHIRIIANLISITAIFCLILGFFFQFNKILLNKNK